MEISDWLVGGFCYGTVRAQAQTSILATRRKATQLTSELMARTMREWLYPHPMALTPVASDPSQSCMGRCVVVGVLMWDY